MKTEFAHASGIEVARRFWLSVGSGLTASFRERDIQRPGCRRNVRWIRRAFAPSALCKTPLAE
jgi:hypothetical protein